ncbi:MAG: DUF4142 domain-containing protein [Pyrinomonadaceae bacterium]
MRRTKMLLISLILSVCAFACAPSGGTNDNGTAEKEKSHTATGADHEKTGNAESKQGTAMLSDADKEFMTEAASGGMLEVELGRLATQRGESAVVKQFGQHMIDDHTRANNELMQVASSKGIALSKELKDEHKKTVERLSKLSNEQFDRAYANDMVEDHVKDVADFQKQAEQGADKDVKAFAAKTLPTLQEHLRMAREMAPKENKEAKQEAARGKS